MRGSGLGALTIGVVAIFALAFAGTGLAHNVKYDTTVTIDRGSVGGDDAAWYGDVASPKSKCLSRRTVKVYRGDDLIGSTKTGEFIEPGHYEVRPGEGWPPPDGTYHSEVKKRDVGKSGHHHICKGATSNESVSVADGDGDGYDFVLDCDDSNDAVYPGATEIAFNGQDDDCDGTVDENNPPDADGDGWTADVDCNDDLPNVHPNATEIVGNGIDDDCDGIVDEGP